MKWLVCGCSLAAVVAGAKPVQASRLDVGELQGGAIIWDGDSDVRTMNVNSAKTEPLGPNIIVTRTLINDFDGVASIGARLFLSVNNADVGQFGAGELITVDQARGPFIKPFMPSFGADINAQVVAFAANLIFNAANSTYTLGAQGQLDLAALLQAHPGVTFIAGLGVTDDGTSLNSCNPDPNFPDDCLGGGPQRARAVFELPTTVPEPSMLLLLGTGLIASRLRRHRK